MTLVDPAIYYFSVRHITLYSYSAPVRESITEVYKQPRSENGQRCLQFTLTTSPRAALTPYNDHHGNTIHYFTIPTPHDELRIVADMLIERHQPPALPAALDADTWEALDHQTATQDFWAMLTPSSRTPITPLVEQFAGQINAVRRADPLTLLRQINSAIFEAFDYVPNATAVDSPIDDALTARKGVCQDFAHVMLAVVRRLGIPCRYVSGYLYYRRDLDRSTPDATHAWVEAYLPSLGWIGFDPTNNILAAERHIRVAIGRDYDDVPPTHGIFKGTVETNLRVEVHIQQVDAPTPDDNFAAPSGWQPNEDEAYSSQQ